MNTSTIISRDIELKVLSQFKDKSLFPMVAKALRLKPDAIYQTYPLGIFWTGDISFFAVHQKRGKKSGGYSPIRVNMSAKFNTETGEILEVVKE